MAGNLALYRKYRSATFAEVIGQEHVTEPLRTALTAGRINHAYLFSGPRGCGKTSSARILARSLNCAEGPTPDPCGVCDSCVELAPNGAGGSIDVIEIDAASHGGVDDARDLRERAFFAPVRDRYKVYIIDEAHMVTAQGFNALLKLVEEPPDFLVFVFATTEPDKVLTTIRSRTHHYPFRLIPPGVMRAHLETICFAEGISVEPAVLPLVVRAGGGSARDSLSILDQLLAGAGPEGVTYSRAVALLGVTDSTLLDDMVDSLAAGDAAGVYGTVDKVVEAGHDPRRFAADLLDRFRDLILLDAVPDAFDRGLIDTPEDRVAAMADQAARIGAASLTRSAEIVHTALLEMRGTTAPRLVLELLCARMCNCPMRRPDSAALLQRLERLERRLSESGSSAPPTGRRSARLPARATLLRGQSRPRHRHRQPTPAPDARGGRRGMRPTPEPEAAARTRSRRPEPEPSAVPEPSPTSEPAAPRRWSSTQLRCEGSGSDVLEVVKRSSRRTRALLDNAQITAAQGVQVTLGAPAALAKMINEDSNTSVLRAALTEVVGGSWRISAEPGVGAAPLPPSMISPTSRTGHRLCQHRANPRHGKLRRRQRRRPHLKAAPEPEPDPRDTTDDDDQGAASSHDPAGDAMRLLEDQLGARPVEALIQPASTSNRLSISARLRVLCQRGMTWFIT